MSTHRPNSTVKMPIVPRSPKHGSGERLSVRSERSVQMTGLRRPPRIVGRYLLCDAFAAGGMATVHLARLMGPEGFSRTVAIKQLHPQFAHDPRFVAMFLDEARLASRVRHPNVVSPLDVISEPPDLYMVMDYVHGEPLSWLLKRRPNEPVPPRIAAAIMGQVLLGLHAAHVASGEQGEPLDLVHRDVSPQNILVTEDGVTKVVDFGIAKAKARTQQTERGMLKGKLGYMAPEQLNMEAVDRRADIFAVGVVLWELLTGRRLFSGDNARAAVVRPREAIQRPSEIVPGLPSDLDDVVMAALGWSPSDRFDNARAMAQALDYSLPAASMLELSAWVNSRVGQELAARAEQVAEVETLSFEDFTRAARHPQAATSLLALEAAPQDSVEPAALSTPPPSFAPKRWRKLWLVPVAACALVAALVLWARARPAPGPVGPTVVALPAPPPTAATAAEAAPPASLLAADPPKPSNPGPAAVTSQATLGSGAKTVASARAKPAARGQCDVPYTIDARGVKRFKEACF